MGLCSQGVLNRNVVRGVVGLSGEKHMLRCMVSAIKMGSNVLWL